MSNHGPTFFGEVRHQGKWHQHDCALFREPDPEMGAYACDCADREIEPDDDDNDPEELTAEESHKLMDSPDMKVGTIQD